MADGEWTIALTRFGLGHRPADRLAGNPRDWLARQVTQYDPAPALVASLPPSDGIAREFANFRRRADDTSEEAKKASKMALRDYLQEAVGARITLAATTATPFAERMVQFWANHFAVSTEKPGAGPLAGSFEAEAIRPHVFGKFADMVLAVEKHPAMLLYLDQAQSIGPNSQRGKRAAQRGRRRAGLNENLAREILELHTLGVRSGYTQADVTEFAKALTGHTVPGLGREGTDSSPAYAFVEQLHEPGTKTILGKRYAEDGGREARTILADLAAHPATAKHIATKLARHFTADDPPQSLVTKLETAFLSSGGDLKAVTLALIGAPEAWEPERRKFLSPWEWSVASLRAIDANAADPMPVRRMMQGLGQDLWKPGSPAGFADTAETWAAPESLHRRVEAAQTIARRAAGRDARALGPQLYPGVWSDNSATMVARAESPAQAMALLLASPEAMWR